MKRPEKFGILNPGSRLQRGDKTEFCTRGKRSEGRRRMYREKREYDIDRDYAVRSRRSVFQKELDSLKRIMYGGGVHIWPYMADAWGDYSEERTVSLVHQIIDREWYERMHLTDYQHYAHRLPFYEKLLYCVLRVLTTEYTAYRDGNIMGGRAPSEITFADLTDVFEWEEDALLDSFTILFMERFYEILTGKKLEIPFRSASLAEWEKWQEGNREIDRMLAEDAEAWDAREEELAKKLGYDIEEVRREDERERELGRQEQEREDQQMRETFPEGEHFCRNLEEVLSYAENNPVERYVVKTELIKLIQEFLSDSRLSVFDEEEAFVETMVQLKRTIRTAKRYAED